MLGNWIIKVLRPSLRDLDFLRKPSQADKPFRYRDLIAIGKDSVVVRKNIDNSVTSFSVEFAGIGVYEEFISELAEY